MSRETGSTYPNFNQLLDKHHSVLACLDLGHKPNENPGAKPKTKEVTYEASKDNKSKTSNGHASSSFGKCKLCLVSGHNTSKCSDYGTVEAKKSKASSLGLAYALNFCLISTKPLIALATKSLFIINGLVVEIQSIMGLCVLRPSKLGLKKKKCLIVKQAQMS